MKVEKISREMIKPSTPTPDHLQKMKLSSLDHLATPNYVTILLFYSSDNHTTSDQLKKSLSETLTHFYPVSGRIKAGDVFLDCNDEGVDFVDARVNCQLSEFLNQVVIIDELDDFLPCNSIVSDADLSTKPLLALQFNLFDCGGFVIGVCFSHKIGDGVSIASFINGWAAATTRQPVVPSINFDLSSLFPVKEVESSNAPPPPPGSQGMQLKIVTRRFTFDASNIAAMRAVLVSSNSTRVELVSALIWWRAMAVARKPENKGSRVYAAIHNTNLRGRMIPPLSNLTFGNVARPTITQFLTEEIESEYKDMVGYIRNSIKKVDEKYVKEVQCGNDLVMDCIRDAKQKFPDSEMVVFNFSSWCRFPFYEANFGCGAPIWVATTKIPGKNSIILMDTKSGDGIEAWVNMLEGDMALLEHDEQFLSFVSSKI